MKILITGGCGFLGTNLATDALLKGDELMVFDNLSRYGSKENLEWLEKKGAYKFELGDIQNQNAIDQVVKSFKPDVVFHLVGQVAMTTSIENPRLDFEINALGTFNLLEAVRNFSPNAIVVYSSTNKVYGDLEQYNYRETETRWECADYPNGFDESIPLDFHSPYGCSKGASDQYMLDYARIFGLRTVVFRHSSMYGGRQFSTVDQGWVGWFCEQALRVQSGDIPAIIQISGLGKQVRDLLHADDMIRLYRSVIIHIDQARGQAFNIGGGMGNSLSLLELFNLLQEMLGIEFSVDKLDARLSDQKVFVANLTKVSRLLEWKPEVNAKDGITRMLSWIKDTKMKRTV
jgi:CDP-paratose 2-epimerase